MSSIDLVILGIVMEKPQSAYDIQKDVEYHHLSRWTKISVPSIYRKVLQMNELLFDFNVVITNLNKMDREKALDLIKKLRGNLTASAKSVDEYAASYPDIPLGGKAIFEQQRLLYQSLLEWLDKFESQFRGS